MAKEPHGIVIDGFDEPYQPAIGRSQDGSENGSPNFEGGNRESQTDDKPASGGFQTLNPLDIGTNSGTVEPATPRRRRGRPPGSTNRPKDGTQESTATNLGTAALESLEALLIGVHFMGAKLLQAPEIELDESEAKKLSDALKNVAKQYQTVVDPKKLALIQLSTVAAGIYVPRVIVLFKGRKKPGPKLVESIDRTTAQSGAGKPNPPKNPAGNTPLVPSQMWNETPIEDV